MRTHTQNTVSGKTIKGHLLHHNNLTQQYNTMSTSENLTLKEVLNKAGASALRGGTAGACAMGANVACLMWMRTTVSDRLAE